MSYARKTVSIIAAIASNGVIGNNGELPWHDADDLKWFKHMTLGKTVIVGRRTFETLPPLQGRDVFVVSRSPQDKVICNAKGCEALAYDAVERAITYAPSKEVFIAGGAQLYAYVLAQGFHDRLYISRIAGEYEGDTYFPQLVLGRK